MMLVGNGVRTGGNPMRAMGGANQLAIERGRWHTPGALRNFHAGEATVIGGAGISKQAGYPYGLLAPGSWSLPNKGGAVKAYRPAGITLSASAALNSGYGASGAASIALGAAGTVNAIAVAAGYASIVLGASGALTGIAAVEGMAAIALGALGSVGAIVPVVGAATITLGASATLGAYANAAGIAYLSSASEGTQLTPATIAEAVLAAAQAAPIHSNIRRVNDLLITGAGVAESDEWRPA